MIEGDIYTALGPLVSNRCYATVFPQDVVFPAIRYTVIAATQSPDICGTDDSVETDDTLVQIDYVAATYGAADALARLGITAMAALSDPPATRQNGGFEEYDPESKVHRVMQEYLFSGSTTWL